MSQIALTLPPEVDILGALYDRSNIKRLDQDMIQIILPGQIVIDVGWYPDRNPNGEYRLVVFQGDVDNKKEAILRTRDVKAVMSAIYRYVAKYLSPIAFLGGDGTPITLLVNGTINANPQRKIDAVADSSTSRFRVTA